MVCIPASINNNLPGSDLSIGADTALNSITTDVDKIKQSAVALHRCFVVEVMGRDCGYLALIGGLATGAERVYLPEEGITLDRLQDDLEALRTGFDLGKRLGLVIRGERADEVFTSSFVESLFAHESGGRFDVRRAILGHVQQGGAPSPFDRIHATRLASAGVDRPDRRSPRRQSDVGDGRGARRQGRVHAVEPVPEPRRTGIPTATVAGLVDGAATGRRRHGRGAPRARYTVRSPSAIRRCR